MDNRDRILGAAARVYSQHGFRGATTRLIAIEAGVNEVTLFRLFGSKAQLFDELLHERLRSTAVTQLPDHPADPAREVTAWCSATLSQMRESRSVLRKMIGEMEERPEAAASACEGPHCAAELLGEYLGRLRASGLAGPELEPGGDRAAISMLMGALFGDAMCRDILPDGFPQPAEEAPAMYVRCFLRAVGVTPEVTAIASAAKPIASRRRSGSSESAAD
jgi:AcrR family transcriptional regulator